MPAGEALLSVGASSAAACCSLPAVRLLAARGPRWGAAPFLAAAGLPVRSAAAPVLLPFAAADFAAAVLAARGSALDVLATSGVATGCSASGLVAETVSAEDPLSEAQQTGRGRGL